MATMDLTVTVLCPSCVDILDYVRKRGWTQRERGGNFWWFNQPIYNDDSALLAIPDGDDYSDVDLRMAEAIRSIAKYEGRSEFKVYRDIMGVDGMTRGWKEVL